MFDRLDIVDPACIIPAGIKLEKDRAEELEKKHNKDSKPIFWALDEDADKNEESSAKFDRLGKEIAEGDRCVCYSNYTFYKHGKKINTMFQYVGEILEFNDRTALVKVIEAENEKNIGHTHNVKYKNIFKL